MERESLDPEQTCMLPPADLDERMAWVRSEILPHTLAHERADDVFALEFADVPGLAERLDRWIEAERDCCSGIDWRRVAKNASGRLRLEIRGLDPDSRVAVALARAAANAATPERTSATPERTSATPERTSATPSATIGAAGSRLARSVGFGAALSLVVCCVLPVAAGALLGAATAAPLSSLDAPGPIAAGAGVGSALAWTWLRQRERRLAREATAPPSCGC